MATIFSASESTVQVDGVGIEGVRSIEYRHQQARSSVYALGSTERLTTISGPQSVEATIRVASTNTKLNEQSPQAMCQITALLKHGTTTMTVTFDECFLLEKRFEIGVGGHAETVYSFAATRVREQAGAAQT